MGFIIQNMLANPLILAMFIFMGFLLTYNVINVVLAYKRKQKAKEDLDTINKKLETLAEAYTKTKTDLKEFLKKSQEDFEKMKKGE